MIKKVKEVKISELIEKLYNYEYLNDQEYNAYLNLVKELKMKEKLHEKTNRMPTK